MVRTVTPPFGPILIGGMALRVLPRAPLDIAAAVMVRRVLAAHPGILDRLESFIDRDVLVDPTDLPVLFHVRLDRPLPRVRVIRDTAPAPEAAATIQGALADLIALAEGRLDGDALFFSRRLAVSGDTELVVALRNALDDARVDLTALALETMGPAAPLGRGLLALGQQLAADLDRVAQAVNAPVLRRVDAQASEIEDLRARIADPPRHRGAAS